MNVLKPNKKISHIETKKDSILVWFEDGEKIAIDPMTYTDQYLYIGKTLTDLEYSKLHSAHDLAPLKKYAFQLVQRGFYTEKQIRLKLYAKDAKRHQVEAILSLLKQYQLVDDTRWLNEHIQYGHEKKWGQHKITAHCLAKGIEETTIKTVVFDSKLELEKATYHLKKWSQYTHRSFLEQKQKFYQYLIGQGFEPWIIQSILEQVPEKNTAEEKNSFKRLYEKVYVRYAKKEKGFRLRQKIIQFMLRKGYNYSDIIAWIGEQDESMD